MWQAKYTTVEPFSTLNSIAEVNCSSVPESMHPDQPKNQTTIILFDTNQVGHCVIPPIGPTNEGSLATPTCLESWHTMNDPLSKEECNQMTLVYEIFVT